MFGTRFINCREARRERDRELDRYHHSSSPVVGMIGQSVIVVVHVAGLLDDACWKCRGAAAPDGDGCTEGELIAVPPGSPDEDESPER